MSRSIQEIYTIRKVKNYGSPNVAILSELNIYSLGKIYGQCENLILIICIENIWAVKKRNAAVTIFL